MALKKRDKLKAKMKEKKKMSLSYSEIGEQDKQHKTPHSQGK